MHSSWVSFQFIIMHITHVQEMTQGEWMNVSSFSTRQSHISKSLPTFPYQFLPAVILFFFYLTGIWPWGLICSWHTHHWTYFLASNQFKEKTQYAFKSCKLSTHCYTNKSVTQNIRKCSWLTDFWATLYIINPIKFVGLEVCTKGRQGKRENAV
jgi:hypothetical protein